MVRLVLIIVCTVVVLGGAFCHAQATTDSKTGSIVGKVVDAQGNGVEETNVSLYAFGETEKPLATTKTDGEGEFTFTAVPSGEGYRVQALKGGMFTKQATKEKITVAANTKTDIGVIELKIKSNK